MPRKHVAFVHLSIVLIQVVEIFLTECVFLFEHVDRCALEVSVDFVGKLCIMELPELRFKVDQYMREEWILAQVVE